MLNIQCIRGGALITKFATALVAAGKKNCSSSTRGRAFGKNSYSDRVSNHDTDDMANIANARRFMDNCMRRGVHQSGGEDSSSSENFKCEITNKNKRAGEVDCNCEFVCMAKVSETMLIHQKGKREEGKK